MAGIVRIRFVGGPLEGDVYEFREHAVLTVGRRRQSAIALPANDPSASRDHFVLELHPPSAVLNDAGSRHGTFVNGERISVLGASPGTEDAGVTLEHGDTVRAGASTLRVEIEAAVVCEVCSGSLDAESRCIQCGSSRAGAPISVVVCATCGRDLGNESQQIDGRPLRCAACEPEPPLRVVQPIGRSRASARRTDGPSSSATQHDFPEIHGYTLFQSLGRGAAGRVYLAQPTAAGSWVALKVLDSEVASTLKGKKRFAREIRLIDQVRHRNIVELLDRGSLGARFFFAMEFCPGGSADQLAASRGGRLQLGETVAIMSQALEGLHYAHTCVVHEQLKDGGMVARRGVVHRDVKPANVVLSGSRHGWVAKLADFGLARCFDVAGLSKCTSTGSAVGSYPYMAQEQLRTPKQVGAPADIWSAGATFYSLFAGRDPRGVANLPQVKQLGAVLYDDAIPLRSVARADTSFDPATVPEGVANVIDASLATDPQDRPASASQFLARLLRATYGPGAARDGVPLITMPASTRSHATAVLVLAPRVAESRDPRPAITVHRQIHDQITRVVGHDGPRALALADGVFVVVLDDAAPALDLARRIEVRLAGARVPVRRVLHTASDVSSSAGVPSGPGVAWARLLAHSEDAPPDGCLITEEAAKALPGGALLAATQLELAPSGSTARRVPVLSLPGPPARS